MSMNDPMDVSVWIETLLRSCDVNTNGLFWYKIAPGLPNASPNAGEKKAGVRGAEVFSLASRPSLPKRKSPFLTSPLSRKELDRPEISTWRSLGRLFKARVVLLALLIMAGVPAKG